MLGRHPARVQEPLDLHIGCATPDDNYIWQSGVVHAIENRKWPVALRRTAAILRVGRDEAAVVLKKTVVMVGMMGAGKTAVGTALARQLVVPFLDSDEEIVRAAQRSIAEIFERDGEPFFRARETEVIGRLLRGPPCVLSTGGGAFLSPVNRDLISLVGASVWLRADLDLLWQRVRHKATRPLLRTANPRQTLADIYALRVPVYRLADFIVDSVPDLTVEAMATLVATALARRPDVLETGDT